MRIRVDVPADRLRGEILGLLARAGHAITQGAYDLALVGTPELVAKYKREQPNAAVIVVTALGDVPARIRALELGGDDAVDPGFPAAQVVARIDAAARRAAQIPRVPEQFSVDGCVVDLTAATAARDATTLPLTAREVDIVRYLARRAGQVVSRADLLQHVWRVAAGLETRAVDVAIVGLRAKLERDPEHPVVIATVRGAGYRFLTNG